MKASTFGLVLVAFGIVLAGLTIVYAILFGYFIAYVTLGPGGKVLTNFNKETVEILFSISVASIVIGALIAYTFRDKSDNSYRNQY